MPVKPLLLFTCLKKDTAEHYLAELRQLFQDRIRLAAHIFEVHGDPRPEKGPAPDAILGKTSAF